MTRVLLTRHGHVDGIEPPRFRGRHDVALSPLGTSQAEALAKTLAKTGAVNAIYTSPMARCIATGAQIATACQSMSRPWPILTDLDYGNWEWRTHEDVEHEAPELYALWRQQPERMRFPAGESLQDLIARTADALRRVAVEHKDETVVLVGHDSVNRAIMMQVLDMPLSAYWRLCFGPCSISEFLIEDTQMRALRINDTAHLR